MGIVDKGVNAQRAIVSAEYHQLSLWYFVSFASAIVYFFTFSNDKSFPFLCVFIFCTSIVIAVISRNSLIILFISLLTTSYCFGFLVSWARYSSIKTNSIEQPIISYIKAEITAITPIRAGNQVFFKNIEFSSKKYKSKNLSKIRINISDKYKIYSNKLHIDKLTIGDVVSFKAKLYPLQTNYLPEGYNFGFFMHMESIEATGYTLSAIEVIEHNEKKFQKIIDYLRSKIYERLINVLGSKKGNFIAAILIGETKAIDETTINEMRYSGASHILSVSGLHLSLVAMICFFSSRVIMNLSNFFAYNVNIKLVSAIFSITGSYIYLLLSGSKIAASRAFIMTSIFTLSIIFGRASHPLRSVMISALCLLSMSPEYIFHPSFQLSFSAVLSLIAGYEFYNKNKHLFGHAVGIIDSIKFYILANIYSSFLASIVTAPFAIYHFYKFASYSIFMNLVAVPIMSFCLMPLALISLILMPLKLDYYTLVAQGFFVEIIQDIARYLVSKPFSVLHIGYISSGSLLFFSFGFFWTIIWQTKIKIIGFVLMIISFVYMIITPKPIALIDWHSKSVLIQTLDKKLTIYGEKQLSKFNLEYITSWMGYESAEFVPIDLKNDNVAVRALYNINIGISSTKCQGADIEIITSNIINCPDAVFFVGPDQLKKNNITAIYCDHNKLCR